MIGKILGAFRKNKEGIHRQQQPATVEVLKLGSLPPKMVLPAKAKEISVLYPYKGYIFIPESLNILKGKEEIIVVSNLTPLEKEVLTLLQNGIQYFDILDCQRRFEIFNLPQDINRLKNYEEKIEKVINEEHKRVAKKIFKAIKKRLPPTLPCETEMISNLPEDKIPFFKILLNLEILKRYRSIFFKAKEQALEKGIDLDICRVFIASITLLEQEEFSFF